MDGRLQATGDPETPFDARQTRWWLHLALVVWGILICLAVGRSALHDLPRHRGCYAVFESGGRGWWNGEPIYDSSDPNSLTVFRYSPLVATMLVPLAWLPSGVGNAALRIANLLVFVCGFLCWARTCLPRPLGAKHQAMLALLLAPLACNSIMDVQLNVGTIGLMLIAMAAAAEDRWNAAALAISLATCVKAYPIALALVLCIVFTRKFAARWLVAMAVCLLLPFLAQRPDYVAQQYHDWVFFGLNARFIPGAFQDLMFFCNRWGIPLDRSSYTMVGIAFGSAIALYCLHDRWRGGQRDALLHCAFVLCCAWMMAFGPATEATTYILLAPAAALATLMAWVTPQAVWYRVAINSAFILLAASQLQLLFPLQRPLHQVGAQPFAAILLMAAVALRQVRMVGPISPAFYGSYGHASPQAA